MKGISERIVFSGNIYVVMMLHSKRKTQSQFSRINVRENLNKYDER